RNFALLHQRRACRLGDEVVPILADVMQYARKIWTKINAHGVTQDVELSHGLVLLSLPEPKIPTVSSVTTTIRQCGSRGLLYRGARSHLATESSLRPSRGRIQLRHLVG